MRKTVELNPVTKSMGIKPVKILNKWKIDEEFSNFCLYIRQCYDNDPVKIPESIMMEFDNLMKDNDPFLNGKKESDE